MTRLVLLGVSVRALAQPVRGSRGGVVGVDFFGDRDREGSVKTLALGRDLGLPPSARGLAAAARRLCAEAVVYCANLENHPEVVAGMARRCDVAGNGAAVLRAVRDPRRLRKVCREEGLAYPVTLLPGEEGGADPRDGWLVKRVRSGGGHGVRRWDGGCLAPGTVLQREVEGTPASVAFAADGRDCRVFGFSEQLIGRAALGAAGHAWCGSLLPFATGGEAEDVLSQATLLARRLTSRFALRGVNGADVIVSRDERGRPSVWLVEVNPRYSASMELVQWASGLDVLALHLDACAGRLPDVAAPAQPSGFFGKGVVYARGPVTVPCTDGWRDLGRRDVPHEGERVGRGHPVCTVLVRGATHDECLRLIERRAAGVYADLAGGAATSGEVRTEARGTGTRGRGAGAGASPHGAGAPSRPGAVVSRDTIDLIGKVVR